VNSNEDMTTPKTPIDQKAYQAGTQSALSDYRITELNEKTDCPYSFESSPKKSTSWFLARNRTFQQLEDQIKINHHN
tara:strand:+ start:1672 stop:1902 length:231 start_codon:yes stop_codon:yes gene_type:complete